MILLRRCLTPHLLVSASGQADTTRKGIDDLMANREATYFSLVMSPFSLQ